MSAVLVTDAEQRAALAAVRSLGRAGHSVCVCSARPRPLAAASRYARADARVPDPLARPEAFVAAVARLVEHRGVDMIMPVADASLTALLPRRDRLPDVIVPCPPWQTHRRISDKAQVAEAAERLGVAVPGRQVLPRPPDVGAAPSDVRFPVAIKPTRSIAEGDDGVCRAGVRYADGPAELDARLADFPAAAYPLLLQQRVVGPGVGVFLLVWRGRHLATFCHRRLREKPPSGGVSVYRESVAPDAALVDRSLALLERFGWEGVAMVEYKRDAATGTPYLMEVNGRFWGSLQLAIDAGVDFPALLAAAAAGTPVRPVHRYRTGVRSRWWWGDVDHLIARLRHSRAALALPAGAPSRWRTLTEFLRVWRPHDRREVLRPHDPRPFLRETAEWLVRR